PDGTLGAVEARGHLDQRRRLAAFAPQPAAQRLPGEVGTLPVTQPDDINEGSLGVIETDGGVGTDIQFLAPEVERFRGEDVKLDMRTQCRNPAAARYGDVDP